MDRDLKFKIWKRKLIKKKMVSDRIWADGRRKQEDLKVNVIPKFPP